MIMPMVDPGWGIVFMLLAFILGLIGGVRLTAGYYYPGSSRMMR